MVQKIQKKIWRKEKRWKRLRQLIMLNFWLIRLNRNKKSRKKRWWKIFKMENCWSNKPKRLNSWMNFWKRKRIKMSKLTIWSFGNNRLNWRGRWMLLSMINRYMLVDYILNIYSNHFFLIYQSIYLFTLFCNLKHFH
jgi:hypothetical protein